MKGKDFELIERNGLTLIKPQWPVPKHICAWITTRHGGSSEGSYRGMNVGDHVDDRPGSVLKNREILRRALNLPSEPCWLNQVHGNRVVAGRDYVPGVQADGLVAKSGEPNGNRVALVMTADCLPVLFTNRQGTAVGAAHAGWRGLAGGVLEATLTAMQSDPAEVMVWLGPAIGPDHFEVGMDVFEAFTRQDSHAESCFQQVDQSHLLADIYALARLRLENVGVRHISGGGFCTYCEKDLFFSYRRESRTGRFASLIYMASDMQSA